MIHHQSGFKIKFHKHKNATVERTTKSFYSLMKKPIKVIQEENYKKFILIYVSDEANDDHAKILEKYDAAYGIGLRYATGQLIEIDNEYKKTFQADSMQDELNQLVFWAVEANIKEILKESSENFCVDNPCDDGKQCVK